MRYFFVCICFQVLFAGALLAQDPEFILSSEPVTIPYYPLTGEASAVQSIYLQESASSPGFPNNVQGWALSYSLSSDALLVSNIVQGEYIQSLGGGAGPDFWSSDFYAEGFTVSTVYGFLGGVLCQYEIAKEVILVELDTVSGQLVGDLVGETISPLFDTFLGSPPVETVIVVAGHSNQVVSFNPGDITLEPIVEIFLRGDYNSDALLNLADAVWLAAALFGTGSVIVCEDAADGNDDGLVNIADTIFLLSYLFIGGTAPAAPFGNCGTDPTLDNLQCPQGQACP